MKINTLAVDLAKGGFQVCGVGPDRAETKEAAPRCGERRWQVQKHAMRRTPLTTKTCAVPRPTRRGYRCAKKPDQRRWTFLLPTEEWVN